MSKKTCLFVQFKYDIEQDLLEIQYLHLNLFTSYNDYTNDDIKFIESSLGVMVCT